MKSLKLGIAAAIAVTALPATAQAATIAVDTSVPAGGFTNDNVMCAMGSTAPCSFSDTGSFVTPTGFNRVSLTISSAIAGDNTATNIDFGTVLFNGASFALTPTGAAEFGSLLNQSLTAGAINTISVSGLTGGNASYRGTLSFANVAAVPEPGTWALMLLGFGAIGFSMRRQRKSAHLYQAA